MSTPYFDEAIAFAKKGFAAMLGYEVEPTPRERELAARGVSSSCVSRTDVN